MGINVDIIRERSTSFSQISSKELSVHSASSSIPYYKKIEIQNNLLNKDKQKLVKSFEFSYISSKE